jgi:hypothetical protein
MNANRYEIQWGFKLQLNKVKASGEPFDFQEEIYRLSGRKYAKAHLIPKECKKITNRRGVIPWEILK